MSEKSNIMKVVFVKYNSSQKRYLFQVPLDQSLKRGDAVKVEGTDDTPICTTDSIFIFDEQLPFLCDITDAYLPLKKVLGVYVLNYVPFS